MLFLAAIKGNYFQWTQLEHDVVMRSPERGQIWDNIAAALNSLQQPKLRVTASLACEQALLFGRDQYSL